MALCGVYQILCTENNKSYIGSSVNVDQRFREHRSHLRRGIHRNPNIQNSWNKYGENAFQFNFMLECDLDSVRVFEKMMIDDIKPEFNAFGIDPENSLLSPSYETRKKISETLTGRKHTPEHNAKISLGLMGNSGPKGHIASKETREKMSIAHKGKGGCPGYRASIETREKLSRARRARDYKRIYGANNENYEFEFKE